MRSRRFNSSKHEIRPSYLLIYLFACVILSFVWQTFDESTPFTSFCTHFKCTVCFHSHFPNFSLFLIPAFNKVEKKWFVYVFKCQFFISYCRLFFVNLFFFSFRSNIFFFLYAHLIRKMSMWKNVLLVFMVKFSNAYNSVEWPFGPFGCGGRKIK